MFYSLILVKWHALFVMMHAIRGYEFVISHALLGKAARIPCLVARGLASFQYEPVLF